MSRVRVYELALEVGVSPSQLMKVLKELGEFPTSASSTLEAPAVMRVFSYFRDRDTSSPREPGAGNNPFATSGRPVAPRPPRAGRNPFAAPGRRVVSPGAGDGSAEQQAADFFGISVSEVPRCRRPRRSQFDQEHRQVDDWLREFIDDSEKRRWMAAGITDDEVQMVLEWKKCGMSVEDLATVWPSGATALDYLRGRADRYTVDQLAQATRARQKSA
ncbi:translation initiation factor IF-2 N-terminal domain-containing protein [Janibacter melonis]|uniref:translation initiation factor IF-2 N-terminal domain-containing protein n=1 Tax=Janibacter melonis TaxID=262209 RepID=UPI002042C268|nr:translation initiation factor IF-2 N-terminal domain-containing protein [Janibacter melonis]MCM3556672.1 translation initiation factor IF-2 N-terminal domain-containing protein [Janibacter melonis]